MTVVVSSRGEKYRWEVEPGVEVPGQRGPVRVSGADNSNYDVALLGGVHAT